MDEVRRTRIETTRNPKGQTKAEILKAGRDMYVNGELREGDERLSDVLGNLGRTTGAAYQIWGNQDEFRHALRASLMEELPLEPAEIFHNLYLGVEPNLDFEKELKVFAADYAAALNAVHVETRMMLHIVTTREPQVELEDAISARYRESTHTVSAVLDLILERHDRCMAEDTTVPILVAAIIALVQGFVTSGTAGGIESLALSRSLVALVKGSTAPN